jgi:hypothetical protein
LRNDHTFDWFGARLLRRGNVGCTMRKLTFQAAGVALALAGISLAPLHAQEVQFRTQTPPNIPLNFGLTPEQVSTALGVPLYYVRGRSGDELLRALPNVKGATLASRSDGLYLQFRNGRLSGWKGDWGTIRP